MGRAVRLPPARVPEPPHPSRVHNGARPYGEHPKLVATSEHTVTAAQGREERMRSPFEIKLAGMTTHAIEVLCGQLTRDMNGHTRPSPDLCERRRLTVEELERRREAVAVAREPVSHHPPITRREAVARLRGARRSMDRGEIFEALEVVISMLETLWSDGGP